MKTIKMIRFINKIKVLQNKVLFRNWLYYSTSKWLSWFEINEYKIIFKI
jgi:hypothetical protein